MGEAPERIWAFQSDGGRRGWLHTRPPQAIIDIPTAYVRADLHDTLTEERDRLKEIVDGTGLATAAIAAERDRLAKANAELLAGLEFYRDGFRYHPKRSVTGISLSEWKPTERLLDDCGETARALLDKHKATSTEREGE